MSIRCRLGWHDYRRDPDSPLRDPTPHEMDRGILWFTHLKCQRCHKPRTAVYSSRRGRYIPPEGIPVPQFTGDWDLKGILSEEEALAGCQRPEPVGEARNREGIPYAIHCTHVRKDHGSWFWHGEDRYSFQPGECEDCPCEGFIG